jgi:hypothetical protein
MKSAAFWVAVVIVAWLGLRHLISILTGWSQDGRLKRGQRLCHATSLLILAGSSVTAVIFRVWWPLLAGVVSEGLFRRFIIWTGKEFPLDENEREMSLRQFIKHITERTNNDET